MVCSVAEQNKDKVMFEPEKNVMLVHNHFVILANYLKWSFTNAD